MGVEPWILYTSCVAMGYHGVAGWSEETRALRTAAASATICAYRHVRCTLSCMVWFEKFCF